MKPSRRATPSGRHSAATLALGAPDELAFFRGALTALPLSLALWPWGLLARLFFGTLTP